MKKIKKIIATIAILTIAVSAMGCKMIEKTPEAIQKTVLATIGNEKITKGDFDKEMSKYDAQLKQQYGDDYATNDKVKDQITKIKKQQLDSLVTEKILLQKATELNLKPSDDDINKQIDDTINQYKTQYPAEGQFESALQQNGITEDELKESLKNEIITKAVQQDMLKDITVTDDDVQTYYDENKDAKYSVGAGATVAHILVADEETAKSLKAKLDAGADFATLAKENSTDTGTKDRGGSLGFVAYNSTELVAEFVNGFKDLKEGEVSEPVKSQYGYHIIKATGLKNAEITPFDQVKDEIKSTLLQQKQGDTFNSKVEEWKTELKVKTNEDKL
ncbi:peptidylprolyl isomerase [Clostridium beijerinckii]|nr:peptidylprolyl isomerase [Clostridium beijerinckii]